MANRKHRRMIKRFYNIDSILRWRIEPIVIIRQAWHLTGVKDPNESTIAQVFTNITLRWYND